MITEIDVDGVLLNLDTPLENMLHSMGYVNFSRQNVKTYDFNKSLDKSKFNFDVGVPVDIILSCYTKLEIFKHAEIDTEAMNKIRELSRISNSTFVIHTLSFTKEIKEFKENLFYNFFKGCKNIEFIGTTGVEKYSLEKSDNVIEDCHLNFRDCSEYTQCYLIDKPYNQLKYNDYCRNILLRNNIIRVKNATEALEKIYNQKG